MEKYAIALMIQILIFFVFYWYLRAYLIKKGEFKAIKEDFSKQLKVLKIQTAELKSIEGQIYNKGWLEQQKWGIKKDFYLKALQLVNQISRHITKLIQMEKKQMQESGRLSISEEQKFIDEYTEKIFVTTQELQLLRDVEAELFLDDETIKALDAYLVSEEQRKRRLLSDLRGGDQLAGYELNNYQSYLCNLDSAINSCKQLIAKEAKSALSIIWK